MEKAIGSEESSWTSFLIYHLTAYLLLDGREVLPGFHLPLSEWFAQTDRDGPNTR